MRSTLPQNRSFCRDTLGEYIVFFLAMKTMELQLRLFLTICIVLHSASPTHADLSDASKGCKESKETAKRVESCPRSEQEWEEAASRKGCQNISHSCSSFEYHCVLNAWKNETIEVCAPIQTIVGNVCAEYSFGGSRIQRNGYAGCQECPAFFFSNESYKYTECYDLVNKTGETSKPIVITTPSTLKITAITDSKEFITPSGQEGASTDPDSDSDLNTKIIIPICVGIASLIVVILICVVYRSRKECSFIEDMMSRICRFRTRQKQINLVENINTNIENTPLKDETTDHCFIKMEPSLEEQQLGDTYNT
ncbi:uncharacterized protein LOC133200459 isoform X1 [Saccostrea echinata]|uniref:uncharacterized protein LOC133200459 isoform X1 n=1 Tax=Saccostrea echinata TaxID=191078 RepID=UPI002A80EE1E|nr:uncharacterized protein LOC133200459 isoform X1 [Saccostrea echinata]